jgi:hypothetical protein
MSEMMKWPIGEEFRPGRPGACGLHASKHNLFYPDEDAGPDSILSIRLIFLSIQFLPEYSG